MSDASLNSDRSQQDSAGNGRESTPHEQSNISQHINVESGAVAYGRKNIVAGERAVILREIQGNITIMGAW